MRSEQALVSFSQGHPGPCPEPTCSLTLRDSYVHNPDVLGTNVHRATLGNWQVNYQCVPQSDNSEMNLIRILKGSQWDWAWVICGSGQTTWSHIHMLLFPLCLLGSSSHSLLLSGITSKINYLHANFYFQPRQKECQKYLLITYVLTPIVFINPQHVVLKRSKASHYIEKWSPRQVSYFPRLHS